MRFKRIDRVRKSNTVFLWKTVVGKTDGGKPDDGKTDVGKSNTVQNVFQAVSENRTRLTVFENRTRLFIFAKDE